MKKVLKFISILCLILLTACGKEKVENKNSVSEVKEIVIGTPSFANTLETTEQYFSWTVARYGVGETLTKFDEKGELVPLLAESWENSKDGKSWKFKIREGVKFSDGTLMTSESVKNSLERTFKLNQRANTFFIPKSIVADKNYLIIETEKPVTTLPGCLADPLFIIVNTEADTTKFAMEGPISTGPYVVEKFNPTEYCSVVRNENYWRGEVPFDRVVFKYINDQATRSLALQSGEIQMAYSLKPENLVDFKNNDKYNIQSIKSLRGTFAFMNENGILKDKVLRQAINRALNKEVYTTVLLGGAATPGKAPVPPTLNFGFDQLVDENTYNPENAKEILAKAGYKDIDGDGYLETPDGQKIELNFVIYTSREELKVYAQAAQVSLKEIGIKVKLITVSYETVLKYRDSGNFDLLIWNVLVANSGDPENYLRENWYSKASTNQTGYNNPKVDALLDELSSEFDPDKRRELIIEIQQLIMDDCATIFFGYETAYLISSTKLKNVVMYPMDYYWLTDKMSF